MKFFVQIFPLMFAIGAVLGSLGCASMGGSGVGRGAVRLELKNPTRTSFGAYRSATRTQEYANEQYENQITRDRRESVEFVVRTEPAQSTHGEVALTLTTTDKSGTQNLNDYGFPELKESIEFHYTPGGQVLKAGEFPETSLFFIPPLPLPPEAVEVGDTWELKHQWISTSGGLLELTAIGIFKAQKRCNSDTCAVLEISGSVAPVGLDNALVQVHSKISGEIFFGIQAGEVVSSHIRSQEQIVLPNMKMVSTSCMVSGEAKGPTLKSASVQSCKL